MLALCSAAVGAPAAAETLKAAHQWRAEPEDFRHRAVVMFAKEVAKAKVDVDIKVYPNSQQMRARQQYPALRKGQLDLSLLPLHFGAVEFPALWATFLPGLVRGHGHAERMRNAGFLSLMRTIAEADGVTVLADIWVSGAVVSKGRCIREPADLAGRSIRTVHGYYQAMAEAAGAGVAELAPMEIFEAFGAGVIDAAMLTFEQLQTLPLQESVNCLTRSGDSGLIFVYQPLVMSRTTYAGLDDRQRKAVRRAAETVEHWARTASPIAERQVVERYRERGVVIADIAEDAARRWDELATRSALAAFALQVPAGAALIELARSAR
jgi:TRAP-type C4-dicarboxylate transport system substrate-binding protein